MRKVDQFAQDRIIDWLLWRFFGVSCSLGAHYGCNIPMATFKRSKQDMMHIHKNLHGTYPNPFERYINSL